MVTLVVTLVNPLPASAIIKAPPAPAIIRTFPPWWACSAPAEFGIAVDKRASKGAKLLNVIARPGGADVELVIADVPGVNRLGQLAIIRANGSLRPLTVIRKPPIFSILGVVPLGHLPQGPSITAWNLELKGSVLPPGLYFVTEAVLTSGGVPNGFPGPAAWGVELKPGGGIAAAQVLPDDRPLRLGKNKRVENIGNYIPGIATRGKPW